jgi:alkylation response protein AidB-like acyl-CoA dehydrogenase
MPSYVAPIRDQAFVIEELCGLAELAALPGCEEASADLVTAVLAEAGRFGAEVLAPLNPVGDREGCTLEGHQVFLPPGFVPAYKQFVDGGWNAVPFDPEHGGQGLPWVVAVAVQEAWHGANMAFALLPMLTQGAVECLARHGTPEVKAMFLDKLVSGEWTGTMNLTEPQAGSDVGALRTKAMRHGDAWRISGQKIFITGGDHDAAANIVHLVLARTPDAPPGVRGISLFVVPKFLPNPDGSLGRRNDLACIKLEEKLGIHGSPTCVMAFGESEGATGWLVGEENQGLALMFTMMNNARLAVGLEGIAVGERATQKAAAYARERVQGGQPIVRYPDVRRMLMTGRALTEATRALAYWVASRIDIAQRHPDAGLRAHAQGLVDLLIPVVKGWGTASGIASADLAIQVFGGMGFIEETGVAQHLRDARITAIYEGTNGIQAMDLVGRKLIRDDGRSLRGLVAEMRDLDGELAARPQPAFASLRRHLAEAVFAVSRAAERLIEGHRAEPHLAGAAGTPFLELLGLTAGGWLMARAALAAARRIDGGSDDPFLADKIATAHFFAEQQMPKVGSLLAQVEAGSATLMAIADDAL